MWRKPLAAVLLVCVVIVAVPASAAERIVWWHWNSGEAEKAFEAVVESFTRNTGIEVEAQAVDWGELKQKLLVGIAGGVAPDVTAVTSTWFEEVALQGAFENLDPYIQRDSPAFWRDIFPSSLAVWQLENGAQYAIPFDNDIPLLFYNMELFDDVGVAYPTSSSNWDDWLAMATRHTRDLDGDGVKDYYGMTNWWFNWHVLVWANNGTFFTPEKRSNLNTPAVRQALEYWAEWFPPKRGLLCAWDELRHVGYDPAARRYPAHAWMGGRIAMAPAGAWMPTHFVWDSAANKWSFPFGVAPLPLSYAGQRATTNEGQANALLASSNHKNAGFQFARWLADHEAQKAAALLNQFPVRRSVALQANLFLAKDKWPADRNTVIQAAEYARPFPKGVNWPVSSAEINKLRDYFNGTQSLDAAVANVGNLLEAKLRELGILR